MFCQKCGREIPDGSAFCGECGTKAGESGMPQVTYIAKEAKPKPILTSGENVLIKVIGILKIIRFSLSLLIILAVGAAWNPIQGGYVPQYYAQALAVVQSVLFLFILLMGAFIFFGAMVLCRKRWALIIFDVFQILGAVISLILILMGNYLSTIELIINIVMVVFLHKCIKALSWETQEARRRSRQAAPPYSDSRGEQGGTEGFPYA